MGGKYQVSIANRDAFAPNRTQALHKEHSLKLSSRQFITNIRLRLLHADFGKPVYELCVSYALTLKLSFQNALHPRVPRIFRAFSHDVSYSITNAIICNAVSLDHPLAL